MTTPIQTGFTSLDQKIKTMVPLDADQLFENFLTDSSNQIAFAYAKMVPEQERPSCLYIKARSGLGKTHLLNAIGNQALRNNPKCEVELISATDFTDEYIAAIRLANLDRLRDKYRDSIDVLLLDDMQRFEGKIESQSEFSLVISRMLDQKKKIVMTGTCEVDHFYEELQGKLGSGITVQIKPLEFETRMSILRKKAAELEIDLPNDVMAILAFSIRSHIGQLVATLKDMVTMSKNLNRKVDAKFIDALLGSSD